jgi:uncharacterized protein YceH (UPF0502 family)
VSDLSAEEVRVLGCLIEKEATVPDTYPMTLNGLRVACNQSTTRDPVVSYDDGTVDRALTSLRERGLTRIIHPSHGSRTTKYRHVAGDVLGLDRPALAVLSVLALRGPQTLRELRDRTERHHPFADLDEVEAALRSLTERDDPLAAQIGRQPGQKDVRYAHMLSGEPTIPLWADVAPAPRTQRQPEAATSAIDDLRAEVAELRTALTELARRLGEEDLLP